MADNKSFKDYKKKFLRNFRSSLDYSHRLLIALPKERRKETENTVLEYFSECENSREFPKPKHIVGIIKKARF